MQNNKEKLSVIFVGGFRHSTPDGSYGGQIRACRTLIDSPISDYVKWIQIDTTMQSNPPPSIFIRLYYSVIRLLQLLIYLIFKEVNTVLIFSSSGYSAYEKGLMVFISKLFHKKVVLSFRSGHLQKDINDSDVMRWFVKKVIRKCDILICQSNYWKKYYGNIVGVNEEKIYIVKNWIKINENYNINKNIEDHNIVNVLYMSRISKSKGIYDLIYTVAKYRNEYTNCKFIICGKGPAYEDVQLLIRANNLEDIFLFEGWITGDKKLSIINNSHIFVLPSYFEGMPNSIIEAMSASLPIISTNVGAIPELVQNEINGFIVTPGNIDELHTSIIKLIKNRELRIKMGLNSRNRVINNHDISKMWVDIYEILLSNEKSMILKN